MRATTMYLTSEAILNVALTIERRAIDFYTRLQHRLDDQLVKELLHEEKKHIVVFKRIFDAESGMLSRQSFENPYMDDTLMAAAFAEVEIFGTLDPDTIQASEVIDAAIAIEKNAILFYTELINVLSADSPEVQVLLKEMLQEERRHMRLLAERKAGTVAAIT